MSSALPFSPAADRNRAPIADLLIPLLPKGATVLEIASGTGQHAEHIATARPDWRWQPSDGDARVLAGIAARCAPLANIAAPLHLDVTSAVWPDQIGRVDAIFCANMLHISPWATCEGLMHGAQRHLLPGGHLVLYGPFVIDGEPTAPSNLAFDADLRSRDLAWGLRRLQDVIDTAARHGIAFVRRMSMPANNQCLVMRRNPPD